MKKLPIYSLLASWIFCGALIQGQVFTPPASSGGSSSPAKPANSSGSSTSSSKSNGSGSDSLIEGFGFDPTSNVADFNGKSFNVKDNDIFRARFEKYLNTEETSDTDSKAYQQALNKVLEILSPRSKHSNKISAAIAGLEFATTFEEDGRLCDSIINAVYRLALTERNKAKLKSLNEHLDKERRRLDWNLRTISAPKLTRTDAEGKATAVADPASASERARIAQRIAEKEKERVANLAKMNLSELQARIEFQGLMVQLFLQRRFEHVIIATRLYTEFYQDGRGKLDLESNVEKTFAESLGYSPTVNTLDSLSNEMIREVKQQIESFQYLVSNNEIDGATRQLQQAFVVGEHLPVVQNVERDKKRKIQSYARNGFQLVNAIEVRNYGLADELLTKMREQASDFDYSKPSAAIETAKLTSDMKLAAARNAFQNNDQAKFEQLIGEATEIWPLNPKIKEGFDEAIGLGDKLAEARRDFDKLLSQENYRQIFDNKERYIIANHEDPDRAANLKQVVENITEINISLEQAKKLVNIGNKHAAWELLSEKFEKYPDDIPLSTQLTQLTPGVSKFAEALSNAKKLEEKDQHGSSLAWYLAARKIFPQSTIAQNGINELVDVILPDQASGE